MFKSLPRFMVFAGRSFGAVAAGYFLGLLIVISSGDASALQSASDCVGTPELCAQVRELQAQLVASKSGQSALSQEAALRLMGYAATLSIALKMLLSGLASWMPLFATTVRGKAAFRSMTIVVGLLAGLFANVGMGIPWWQAMIIVGGGPAAVAVHELMKLVPALRGKTVSLPDDVGGTTVDAQVASDKDSK